MMRFVEIIKEQIQQLDIPELRIWLLSHFNEQANHLTELFCREIHHSSASQLHYAVSVIQFPPHLSVLSLAYIYLPLPLREELAEKLQNYAPWPEVSDVQHLIGLGEQFNEQLTDYQTAWPIIDALQKQGINYLIRVLDKADEQSLKAFARLNKGRDLNLLIETFLVNNSRDLEAVNRNKLIQFLRQPDFSGIMHRCLDALANQASIALSVKLLSFLSAPCSNHLEQLLELKKHVASYHCPVDLQVLLAICNVYQHYLQQHSSDEGDAFISLVHDVLHGMNATAKIEFIKKLGPDRAKLVIEYCLKRSAEEMGQRHIYSDVLDLFCSSINLLDDHYLRIIRESLGRHDLHLFGSASLYELAKDVLAETKSTVKTSLGGEWIGQLLASPRFIAASTPQIVKRLSERYRLLRFTLSPLENASLLASLQGQDFYAEEIQEQMHNLAQKGLNHDEPDSELIVKQNKLLKFSIERSLSAFMFQMETQCDLLQDEDPETAKKALAVLYQYYKQIYPDFRSDLLRYWQKLCSPEFDADQKIARKNGVYLFDSAGQKIGFLNESNQAVTFVDEELVLLIHTGSVQVNECVYDKDGATIGLFTESGHLRSVDEATQNASAQIIRGLSEKELQLPAAGLDVLLHNVLFENSIGVLYGEDSIQKPWLDRRLADVLQRTEKKVATETLSSFLDNANDESIFILLGKIQHQENALALFHELLNNDKTRALLFSGLYESDFQHFLDRHGSALCLADYMMHFHDTPWFAEGLMHFAYYGKKRKTKHLLSDSLALLFDEKEQNTDAMVTGDAILRQLLDSEACATVVLKEFFNDRNRLAPQNEAEAQINNAEIDKVMGYFQKKHIIHALRHLNSTPYWQEKSQYKFFLYILDKQHDVLFAANQNWQSNELNDLTRFVNRHLSKKRAFDHDFIIGHRVLGELIFRSARLGQISLFYAGKKFNTSLARLSFGRNFLERLVTKFWIPEGVKEQIVDEVSRIKTLFQDPSLLHNEFREDQVVQDWRHLVHQTWREINKKKLPMICAYLLNYSGQKKALVHLLNDYFNSFQHTMNYIYPVTKLLKDFPERDVSAVIFDVLEAFLIKNPHLLDSNTLSDMACYFAKKTNQDVKSPQAELNVLIYLGQCKHYALVKKGCDELARDCENMELRQRLLRGANEAEVERDLSTRLGRFYFGLLKLIKRWWNYGFNAKENRSRIVKFCDDDSPNPQRDKALNDVKIPAKSARESGTYPGFAIKRKQLINLLDTVKRSSVSKSFATLPVHGKQSLFGATAYVPAEKQNNRVKADELSVSAI
ncbi:hypothetical protein [Legionella shakespearei]|uniref:Dot/Icm T4SS effector n=1 Tax=Legionella shakespearei DSM 23087 TaxID=1122169 RepID=A0A0W0Z037_9GAMM|nr:hypothetical protein [Legionella shakespearei]KTD62501.1 Dot/Icm T4SS effector [Legionella shakespearei DSM 23087]